MEPDVPRKTTSRSTAADCTQALKVTLVRADTGRMRRTRGSRSYGLGRQLTLLRAFLAVSAIILAIGAFALSSRLSGDLRRAALADTARDVDSYVEAALSPAVVHAGRVAVTPAQRRRLQRAVRLPNDVRGLSVYAKGGRLVFSTTRADRVGRVRTSPDLRAAVQLNEPSAEIVDPIGPGGE